MSDVIVHGLQSEPFEDVRVVDVVVVLYTRGDVERRSAAAIPGFCYLFHLDDCWVPRQRTIHERAAQLP